MPSANLPGYDLTGRDHLDRRIDSLVACALHRRTLRLSCRQCPHIRLLDSVPIWSLFDARGWGGLIADVPKRFYCARCWDERRCKVSHPKLVITQDATAPPQFPYPDERRWKRLVSRYRS